jgi:hypothetical protein
MEAPADDRVRPARTRLPGVAGPAFDDVDAPTEDEARRTAALLLLLGGAGGEGSLPGARG